MTAQVSSTPNFEGYPLTPPDDTATVEQNEREVLRSQLNKLFEQFDTKKSGRIASKDLVSMIELFESNQHKRLLTEETRPTFRAFCLTNPDMEVSIDDIIELVDQLRPSAPSNLNDSAPSTPAREPEVTRPRTTPITKFGYVRNKWNRRPSPSPSSHGDISRELAPDHDTHNDTDYMAQEQLMISSTGMTPYVRNRRPSAKPEDIMGGTMARTFYGQMNDDDDLETSFEASGAIDANVAQLVPDDPAVQLSKLYRHTVELTKKLKESERHLASVARQHEDRIEELQHKLEETKKDLLQKKREIQDHKSKEKTNLNQISALENEITKVARNLTGQKSLYINLKKQYEEQTEEAEKLRDLVRVKEEHLAKTVTNLSVFEHEAQKWYDERDQLERALAKLEKEIAIAQQSEIELEEQKNENSHLKSTIDKLKLDLAEIRDSGGRAVKNDFDVTEVGTYKNLQTELIDHIRHSMDEEGGSDSNVEEVDPQSDRRSSKAHRRRKEDKSEVPIADMPNEELALVRTNEVEKYRPTTEPEAGSRKTKSSRKQIADGNGVRNNSIENQYQVLSSELGVQYAIIENLLRNQQTPTHHEKRAIRSGHENDNTDVTRPRVTRKATRNRKRGEVKPYPEIESAPNSETQSIPTSRALVPRNQANTVAQQNVNSTVTFALYTLVVYLFGIITSVFVLDNNQGSIGYADWTGFDSTGQDSVMARSVQIILYWLETLLNDGNNMVPT